MENQHQLEFESFQLDLRDERLWRGREGGDIRGETCDVKSGIAIKRRSLNISR